MMSTSTSSPSSSTTDANGHNSTVPTPTTYVDITVDQRELPPWYPYRLGLLDDCCGSSDDSGGNGSSNNNNKNKNNKNNADDDGNYNGRDANNGIKHNVGKRKQQPQQRQDQQQKHYHQGKQRGRRPIYHGNQRALAWAMDGIGRAVQFIGAGAFFGTAVLRLAKEAAGCITSAPDDYDGEEPYIIPECNNTITLLGDNTWKMKPSSILTTYTMIVGLLSAVCLPLMGAIVDYTPHRLTVGRTLTAIFCILILPTIFLDEDNFISLAFVQIFISFVGWGQTSISYAYLPEITQDELLLNDYTKSFTMSSFLSMLIYLSLVIGGVSVAGYGDNDIVTSRVGMTVAFCVSLVMLVPAWARLFDARPALHRLEDTKYKSLWSAGFVQLYDTSKHIVKHYPSLKWFYVSIAFSDAGLQALATIAITYLTDQLQFTARENGIAILFMLLGSIPGAALSNFVTRRLDPVQSNMSSIVIIIATTVFFAIFLKPGQPNQHLEAYILSCVWGMGSGWKWTCDRLIASSIIPQGQDAELMGFFLFAGQVLSWVPPLVFTAINEASSSPSSQQFGVASLNVYFLFALFCYMFGMKGGYAEARRQVQRQTAFGGNANISNTGSPATSTRTNDDDVDNNNDSRSSGKGFTTTTTTTTSDASGTPILSSNV